MGNVDQLRALPDGWRWEGPAARYLEWLDYEVLLKFPFAGGKVLPAGSEDSTWLLHSQYVCPSGTDPDDLGDLWLGQGFSPSPPKGWQRVLWNDVAAAKGVDLSGPLLKGREYPPSDLWDAVLDRPLFNAAAEDAFIQPSVGSMSQLELEQLVPILAMHTSSPRILGIPSYLDPMGAVEGQEGDEQRYAFSFQLPNLVKDLLSNPDPNERLTPELWWPEDDSWLIWNDYDLMGTKIFGSHALIQQIRDHPVIETLDWFPSHQ